MYTESCIFADIDIEDKKENIFLEIIDKKFNTIAWHIHIYMIS